MRKKLSQRYFLMIHTDDLIACREEDALMKLRSTQEELSKLRIHGSHSEDVQTWKSKYEETLMKARIDEARYHRLEIEKESLETSIHELKERIRFLEEAGKENEPLPKDIADLGLGDMGKKLIQLQDQNLALRKALEQAKEV